VLISDQSIIMIGRNSCLSIDIDRIIDWRFTKGSCEKIEVNCEGEWIDLIMDGPNRNESINDALAIGCSLINILSAHKNSFKK
jgi:hypothetical protein